MNSLALKIFKSMDNISVLGNEENKKYKAAIIVNEFLYKTICMFIAL